MTVKVTALLPLLALAACGTPPGSYSRPAAAGAALEEFPLVARNCEIPEVALTHFSDEELLFRLLVPAEIYASREAEPTRGRIACIQHWADERGLRLVVLGTRR